MIKTKDPFEGWTMANVGCHWSRVLPAGNIAHLSSWARGDGKEGGYALTIDFKRQDFPNLEEALVGYAEVERRQYVEYARLDLEKVIQHLTEATEGSSLDDPLLGVLAQLEQMRNGEESPLVAATTVTQDE